jgi:hypothetical protein
MESPAKSPESARRGTRIRAQIPLRLTSMDPAIKFSEQCHTLVVNMQGCGVRLARALEPGMPIRMDELPGGKSVMARVANCVPLGADGKYWLVGLALEQPGNVWCIHPVPADWGSESAPVAAATVVPAKRNEWPYSQFSDKGEFHPGRK